MSDDLMRAPSINLMDVVRTAICALFVVLTSPASGRDVVIPAQLNKLETKASASTAAVTEQGNVTIIDYADNFDANNFAARQQVASRFYQTHADDFDFLVFFTTFDIVMPELGANGFYTRVQDDVQGIGLTPLNNSQYYGSQGKLHGLVDMGHVTDDVLDPLSPSFQPKLSVLAHEVMHRWCCFIDYLHNGVADASLLGHDGVHWSYFLDTDASVMYGSDWSEISPGQFEAEAVVKNYSPLDLYLAGFYAKGEVPDFFLIRNAPGDPTTFPVLFAQVAGQAENISIDQIIAQEGPRIPGVADAPTHFRAKFILLRRPGEQVSQGVLIGLEALRREFEQRFAIMTDGRAQIDIRPDVPAVASAGSPSPLSGSAPAGATANVAQALSWLDSHQLTSGAWQDKPATTLRDTASVITALAELGDTQANLAQARTWIATAGSGTVDDLAQRLRVTGDAATTNALVAAGRSDGGWGLTGTHRSNPFDTSIVLDALPSAAAQHAAAIAYLKSVQNADGSFGAPEHGAGRVVTTARVLTQLQASDGSCTDACATAKQWLVAQQSAQGGFGDNASTALETAEAMLAIGRVDPSSSALAGAAGYLGTLQGSSGDWGGSAHTTARAALAIARLARPNLYIVGAPTATPSHPEDGDRVSLIAVVGNSGSVASPAAIARWYEGKPELGGTQIGSDMVIPPLPPGTSWPISTVWNTLGLAGAHDLWLLVDATDVVNELNKNDNEAELQLTVAPPSTLPDLAVFSSELQVTPSSITQLPTTIHVTGTLWNLGTTAVASTSLSLAQVVGNTDMIVTTQTLAAPARTGTAFAFDYNVTQAGAVKLAVIADPNNQIVEASKDNNRAEITVGAQAGVDLEVTNADLRIDTPNPTASIDVNFHITVRNRGTVDSPITRLLTQVDDGSGPVTIDDQQVQLNAGVEVTREITWRPTVPGNYTLLVTIDPDNLVAETDKSNNSATLAFAVAAMQGPNLSIGPSDIVLSPSPPLEGADLNVGMTVHNTGVDAAGAFVVTLYDGDPRAGGSQLGQASVSGLAAGASTTANVDLPNLALHGDHYFYAFADSANAIPEQNKTDNLAFVQAHVLSLPDLAITPSAITVTPTNPVPGQSATVHATVRNLGEQSVASADVQLFEGTPQAGAMVSPTQTVANLGGLSSADVSWTWTFGLFTGADRLTVVVDPSNAVRESNENNNSASVPLNVQNGDLFVTERYISPNGDGVQDASTIVVRSGVGAYARMDILNSQSVTVRSFDAATISAAGGQATWDGRDDNGIIVHDDDYRVTLRRDDGSFVAQTLVTVDNNRSPLADAIGTALQHDQWFDSFLSNEFDPYANGSGRPGLLLIDPYDASSHTQLAGLYRTIFGGLQPVLTLHWITQQAGFTTPDEIELNLYAGSISSFGPLAWVDISNCTPPPPQGGTYTCTAKMSVLVNLDHTDDARILPFSVRLDGAYAGLTFVSATMGYTSDSNGQYYAVDLATESTRPLTVQAADEAFLGSTSEGLYFSPDRANQIRFVPFAAGAAERDWTTTGIPDAYSGLYLYGNYLWVPFVDSAGAHYRVFDNTGQVVLDYTYPIPQGTPQVYPAYDGFYIYDFTNTSDHVSARIFPSPDGSRLIVLDVQNGKISTVDVKTGAANEFPIPRDLNPPNYLQNVDHKLIGISDFFTGTCGYIAPEHSVIDVIDDEPGHIKTIIESGFYGDAGIFWSWDYSHVLLSYGDVVNGTCVQVGGGPQIVNAPGINRVFDLDLNSGNWNELDRYTSWPTDTLSANYPWTHTVLEKDGGFTVTLPSDPSFDYLRVSRDVATGYVMSGDTGVFRERDIPKDNPNYSQGVTQFGLTTSLQNLTAHLEAIGLGTTFILHGIAADKNFAYYQLDWALQSDPETWHPITDPITDQVIDDEFLWWSPPATGPLLVRLSVADKAGNEASDTIEVDSIASSPLGRVTVSPRYISPNGDGVQDEASISFDVLQPAVIDIDVVNTQGALVYHLERTYGSADLGAHDEVWDGRNQSGGLVPDGTYFINIAGSRYTVIVDVGLPVVSGAKVLDPYQSNPQTGEVKVGAALLWTPSDANLSLADLQFGPGSQPSRWNLYKDFASPVSGQQLTQSLPVADYRDDSFRVTVADKAGNQARSSFTKPAVTDGRLIFESIGQQQACPISQINAQQSDQPIPLQPLLYQSRPFAQNPIPGRVTFSAADDSDVAIPLRVWDVIPEHVNQLWIEVQPAPDQAWQRLNIDPSQLVESADGRFDLQVSRDAIAALLHGVQNPQPAIRISALSGSAEVVASNATQFVIACPNRGGKSNNGNGSGSGGNNPPPAFDVRISPLSSSIACGTPASNKVLLEVAIPAAPPVATHLGATYSDPTSGQLQTLLDVENPQPDPSGQCVYPYQNVLDLSGLPEGQVAVVVTIDFADGTHATNMLNVPVDHTPPSVRIGTPADGTRVCVNTQQNPLSIPISGMASDQVGFGYRLQFSSAQTPDQWSLIKHAGYDTASPSCYDHASHLTGFTLHGVNGPLGDLAQPESQASLLKNLNGAGTLQLLATDWSGAVVCTNNTVVFDTDVDAGATGFDPILPWYTGPPRIGLSLAAGSTNTIARAHVQAQEPVTADVEIHPVAVSASGDWSSDDNTVLGVAQAAVPINGLGDLTWDGSLGGGPAPDDDYAMVLVLHDDCVHTRKFVQFVTIDSTPPALSITSPQSGASIAATIVEVLGTASDPHFDHYALDVSANGGDWQPIASSNAPLDSAGVLGDWVLGNASGNFVLRLQAYDRLGNGSSVQIPLTRPQGAGLLLGVSLQPAVISPNGDGQFDQANLIVTLGSSAALTVTIADGGGQTVATLANGDTRAAGAQPLVWDGRTAAGVVAPDGDYTIAIRAADPSNPNLFDLAQLAIAVDTAKPLLQVVAPTGAYSNGSGSVRFQVSDSHLATVHAQLTGDQLAVPVVINDSHSGTYDVAMLTALPEGKYQLVLDASDVAANTNRVATQFVLDRTSPTALLQTPIDGQPILRNAAFQVTGSANDVNFDHYDLAFASTAAPDTWAVIASGQTPVTNGALAVWTPSGNDGSYRLRLRVYDKAGNTTDALLGVVIDGTPPVVQITAPSDGAYVPGNFAVMGTVTDDHLSEYRVSIATSDNGPWSDLTRATAPVTNGVLGNVQIALADGSYALRVQAKDAVGLTASALVHIRLVRTPPPAPTGLVAQVVQNRDVQLNWTAVSASDFAGYIVYRSGVRITANPVIASAYLDANAPEGTLSYQVSAIDLAGNESPRSAPAIAIIDHTPPATSISSPLEGARVRAVLEINGTAHSVGDFKDYSLSVQPTVPPGTNTPIAQSSVPVNGAPLGQWDTTTVANETQVRITLAAEDIHGNVGTSTVDVTVDNQPPAAPTGLQAVLTGDNVQASWNANTESDLLGYLLYRNGQLVGWQGSPPSDLRGAAISTTSAADANAPNGAMTYIVYAIDLAGNISPPSAPATVSPSTHAPQLTIVLPHDGYRFAQTAHIVAQSPDLDIAQVAFAYRPVNGSTWTTIGSPVTTVPYEVFWTPGNLPHGDYQITASATNIGGLTTLNPPIVQVHYTTAAPPPQVSGLVAHAAGDTVQLSWQVVTAPSIIGYQVVRTDANGADTIVNVTPVAGASLSDSAVADGSYAYRVYAVDDDNNAGPRSDPATVRVFTPQLDQPYTPTLQATTALTGTSVVPGTIGLTVGGSPIDGGSTDAAGVISVANVALSRGDNSVVLRITDAAGNVSKPAQVIVSHDTAPLAPTGLVATVTDHHVDVTWNANTEDNLLGYRLFRRGHEVWPDAPLAQTLTAQSSAGLAAAAIDNNPATAWIVYPLGPASSPFAYLELDWNDASIVTALHVQWSDASHAASAARVDAWNEAASAWVTVANLGANTSADSFMALAQPYRTTRLRLTPLAGTADGVAIGVAEISVIERPVQNVTTFAEDLIDGQYAYTVTAVNSYAFESVSSQAANAAVGDTTPPDAVTLSASVSGSDAQLSWTASTAPDLAGYFVYRNGAQVATVLAPQITYTDANLANGQYEYYVVAVDQFLNASANSNTVDVDIAATGPAAPIDLVVTTPQAGAALDISWQPGSGPAPGQYTLYRGPAVAGPFAAVATTAAMSYHDAPLANGTTYYYTVVALDAAGNASAQSAVASGTPRDVLPPAPPELFYPTVPAVPLTVTTPQITVQGMAEPGAFVDLLVNGTKVASQQSLAATTLDSVDSFATPSTIIVSPNGRWAWMGVNIIDLIGTHNAIDLYFSHTVSWGADSDTAYFTDGNSVQAYDLSTDQVGSVDFGVSQPQFAFLTPDGAHVLIGGTHDSGGTPTSAIWLVNVTNTADVQSFNVDPSSVDYSTFAWSRDGAHFAIRSGSGNLLIGDVASSQISTAMDQVQNGTVSWSADGAALAVSRLDSATNTQQVAIYTLATQATSWFSPSPAGQFDPVFSPDGNSLAFITDGQAVEVHAWPSGTLQSSDAVASAYALAWPTDGRIIVGSNSALVRVNLPGFFEFDNVAVPPGTNLFVAQATDAAGNISLPSMPLTITRAATGLPDLAISSNDISFVPELGLVGLDYSASITVHNVGAEASSLVPVAVTLTDPQGVAHSITPRPTIGALDPGASQVLAIDLGVLNQPGAYRLQVQVDPDGTLDEASKNNNSATAILALTAQGSPLLDLALTQSAFAPGADVSGSIAVTGSGANFSGSISVAAEDVQGTLIAQISTDTIAGLAAGQQWTRPVTWTPQDVLAGTYQLHAVLRDTNATIVAERIAVFDIADVAHVQLGVAPGQATYAPGANAAINLTVNYADGNALLANAQLVLSILDSSNNQIMSSSRALGDLLPGYQAQTSVPWNVPANASGVYALNLALQSGSANYAVSNSVQVVASTPTVAVGGTIALKVPPLAIGRPVIATYTVSNLGTQSLSALPLRVRLIATSGPTEVANATTQVDIAAGGSITADADVSTNALTFGNYLLVLEAQVPGVAGGGWALLAQIGAPAVDITPPVVSLIAPAPGSIGRLPIAATVSAVDAQSRVDRVEVSVDGGAWATATLQSNATYVVSLVGLADGTHALQARATDAWGNRATTAPQSFIVDNTPPQITIGGVSNGQLSNQPLTPTVAISDANLAASSVRVNAAAFVSGTTITADGSYTLTVSASDQAGNTSFANVSFTIDRTAPTLSFLAPAPGAIVTQDHVDVVTASEAGARVELQRGIYTAAGNADTAGHLTFSAVPLDVGDNVIMARAIDAAGNASAWMSLHVTRQANTTGISGTLTPSGNQIAAGAPLTLQYAIDNATAQPVSALPLRLRVVDASTSAEVGNVAFNLDVPAQGSATGQNVFDTSTWTLDTYTAYLEADLSSVGGSSGWTPLDQATFDLVDRTPPVLSVSSPTPQAYFNGVVTVVAQAQDTLSGVASVEMRVDGGAWVPLTLTDPAQGIYQSSALVLVDGSHTLDARATDAAANVAEIDGIVFYVDTVAPLIDIAGVADGERTAQNVTPSITITDASPVAATATLDGAPFVSGTLITAEGTHTLAVNATDAAGNTAAAIVHFTIDRTGPSLTIAAPANGAILAQNPIHVSGQTDALAGVDVQTGTFSAHVSADAQGHFDVAGVSLVEGSNTISAHATDDLGNVGPTASVTVTYAPASAATISGQLALQPALVPFGGSFNADYTITNTGAAALTGLPLQITVTTSGNGVAQNTTTIDVGASAQQSASMSFSTSGWALGNYSVSLLAQVHDVHDALVWVTLDTQTLVVADTTPPQVSVQAPTAGAYFNGNVAVLATATDALSTVATVEVQVDSGLWQPLVAGASPNTYQTTLTLLAEGDHALRVRAHDTWSNVGMSPDVAFHIDRTPPTISVTGVANGVFYNHAVSPTITISDASPLAQQDITLDGAPYTSGTSISTEGAHVLHVHAQDVAGNDAVSDTAFTIDTTPPQITFTAPQDNAVVTASTVDVAGTTEALASVEVDAGAFSAQVQADAQGAFTALAVPLQAGANAIRARATDRAGNVGAFSQITVTSQPASCPGFVPSHAFTNGFETASAIVDYVFCNGFELTP
jgi:subtilase family serine protease